LDCLPLNNNKALLMKKSFYIIFSTNLSDILIIIRSVSVNKYKVFSAFFIKSLPPEVPEVCYIWEISLEIAKQNKKLI
jgi:hypothetical protein